MTRRKIYAAVLASAVAFYGFGAAQAGNLVFEAEEEQEVIVADEPMGSSNSSATVSASSQSAYQTNDEEKDEQPARAAKTKRSPR